MVKETAERGFHCEPTPKSCYSNQDCVAATPAFIPRAGGIDFHEITAGIFASLVCKYVSRTWRLAVGFLYGTHSDFEVEIRLFG